MQGIRWIAPILIIGLVLMQACVSPPESTVIFQNEEIETGMPATPAILEGLAIKIEYLARIRSGEIGLVTMTVATMDEPTSFPIPGFSDAYEEFTVLAEAELDLPRILVQPSGTISQPMPGKQAVAFTWYLHTRAVGSYKGTAWLRFKFIPRYGNGQEETLFITAFPIDIQVISLGGMNSRTTRFLGISGILLGVLLAIPFIIGWIEKKYQAKEM